jgi:hypothetical protein
MLEQVFFFTKRIGPSRNLRKSGRFSYTVYEEIRKGRVSYHVRKSANVLIINEDFVPGPFPEVPFFAGSERRKIDRNEYDHVLE